MVCPLLEVASTAGVLSTWRLCNDAESAIANRALELFFGAIKVMSNDAIWTLRPLALRALRDCMEKRDAACRPGFRCVTALRRRYGGWRGAVRGRELAVKRTVPRARVTVW